MRFVRVLSWFVLVAGIAGCQQAPPAPAPGAATTAGAPAAQPYGSLAQVMRGIPFPNSNIIFDTQTNDPGVAKKTDGKDQGATSTYANTYGGWQQVENAAVALSETANLVMIPGRKCENGLPVPIGDALFQKGAKGLAEVGKQALEAAKTKNIDKMVDVSGAISDACLVCHEKYREVPQGKMRCVPVP
jgi:hypothetical protein